VKKTILLIAVLTSFLVRGQKTIKPADTLRVSGKIKTELAFTLSDFDKFSSNKISDITITNHLGEPKGTAKNLKGFLLKSLLDKIEYPSENPKLLSEFYFVFLASDGYKVVFSWNEIYNTETGNNLYLITEEGKGIKDMPDRILIISTKDFKTGRRFIKGLERIMVERAY
jgi:hypothetical protein